jgi:hypothetical protein
MSVQPCPVLEKPPEGFRDLKMLVSLWSAHFPKLLIKRLQNVGASGAVLFKVAQQAVGRSLQRQAVQRMFVPFAEHLLDNGSSHLDRLMARHPDGIFVAPFEQGEIGPDLFQAACRMGLEGLVSKRRDRPYQAGRSKHGV